MGIAFSQELQHVEHEQLARRKPAADEPVEIIRFQALGGKMPDPFLAIATVRDLQIGAGNGESDFLSGHLNPRQHDVDTTGNFPRGNSRA